VTKSYPIPAFARRTFNWVTFMDFFPNIMNIRMFLYIVYLNNPLKKLLLFFNGKIIKDNSKVGERTLHIRKGIYIGGPLGSEIKAVFPGRVDFSGQLKGYGQVIIINHGSRFFTISAHLLQRNKEEGDMIEEGDVIGLLGQSGSLSGPRLYFEVRKAGKNLDPIKWLKVH